MSPDLDGDLTSFSVVGSVGWVVADDVAQVQIREDAVVEYEPAKCYGILRGLCFTRRLKTQA